MTWLQVGFQFLWLMFNFLVPCFCKRNCLFVVSHFFLLIFLGIEYWREKKKKIYNEMFIQNMWWTKALKKWTKVLITIVGLHIFWDICGKCGRDSSRFYLELVLAIKFLINRMMNIVPFPSCQRIFLGCGVCQVVPLWLWQPNSTCQTQWIHF
jgi:hypothetical protein